MIITRWGKAVLLFCSMVGKMCKDRTLIIQTHPLSIVYFKTMVLLAIMMEFKGLEELFMQMTGQVLK